MFDRIISVDWSGAGSETEGVDLRIAVFDAATNRSRIVDRPYKRRMAASWSRQAFRNWIIGELQDKRPALIPMDFGFGLPWKTDQAVFGVAGWREMIRKIAENYEKKETARSTAQSINDDERFGGHGPYRFDENRNDFRFYLDHGVAYYRLAELIAPQGISQWYLGSGGTVGYHTISGLAWINYMIGEREAGKVDFVIWPHECFTPDGTKHVLVESYPAICPRLFCPSCGAVYPPRNATSKYVPRHCGACAGTGPWVDSNQEDAWKVLQGILKRRNEGTLSDLFHIQEQSFGRITGVEFEEQIQFEGFIFGLR